MCNHTHKNSKVPKKKEGIGYKIFKRSSDGELLPLVGFGRYDRNQDGTIGWNPAFGSRLNGGDDYGFCCFASLREASDALSSWGHNRDLRSHNLGIYKIMYFDAIARHLETSMCDRFFYHPGSPKTGFRVLLVKKFKVVAKVSEDVQ